MWKKGDAIGLSVKRPYKACRLLVRFAVELRFEGELMNGPVGVLMTFHPFKVNVDLELAPHVMDCIDHVLFREQFTIGVVSSCSTGVIDS